MTVAGAYVADPLFARVPVAELLAAPPVLLALPSAMASPIAWESPAYPPGASDTVLLAVVDAQGNAVAFINSVDGSFGSCSAAETLGFPIQNLGFEFTLEQGHPNQLEGGKRQYHTIIPAMAMQNGAPSVLFGMTGGFLQPQGHLQQVVNLLDYGMDPQSAIDMPRFWWQGHRDVIIENGFPEEAYATLMTWGHQVMRRPEHRGFGRAQVIRIDHDGRVLIAGSGSAIDRTAWRPPGAIRRVLLQTPTAPGPEQNVASRRAAGAKKCHLFLACRLRRKSNRWLPGRLRAR
jgi:gamma-glutamyltranspeptidase/glutathione hydrolase